MEQIQFCLMMQAIWWSGYINATEKNERPFIFWVSVWTAFLFLAIIDRVK